MLTKLTSLAFVAVIVACTDRGVGPVSPPPPPPPPPPPATAECAHPQAGWIWCDDFEQDRRSQYFEYDSGGGAFTRTAAVGMNGSSAMRTRFAAGRVSAGALHLAIGKMPAGFRAADAGTTVYRDVYWRLYVRNQAGWVGGSGWKLSRAISFASPSWAEAMIGHVWGDSSNHLSLDPVSGTDPTGILKTTVYNDGPNLRWLGARPGVTPLFDASHVGRWYCVEAHAKLNDLVLPNGVFEFWVDGLLQARDSTLNFVGAFSDYGINAVFVENYWNTGSPKAQQRYIDNFVVSTQRIGCSPP